MFLFYVNTFVQIHNNNNEQPTPKYKNCKIWQLSKQKLNSSPANLAIMSFLIKFILVWVKKSNSTTTIKHDFYVIEVSENQQAFAIN